MLRGLLVQYSPVLQCGCALKSVAVGLNLCLFSVQRSSIVLNFSDYCYRQCATEVASFQQFLL